MTKESLRVRRRREAREQLEGGTCCRQPPSAAQVTQLLAAVDGAVVDGGKHAQCMGLAKMVALDLDGLHEPPVYVREKGGPLNC